MLEQAEQPQYLKHALCAEFEEVQPSGEASVVNVRQKQAAKKGRKAKKKGPVASIQEGESSGSTSARPSAIMDPSKGSLDCCQF